MPAIRPSLIGSPLEHEQQLFWQPLCWRAYDAANPRVEVQVEGVNEFAARVAGGIALRQPAWRIRVRPAVRSSLQA